jgi:hypothetical protein
MSQIAIQLDGYSFPLRFSGNGQAFAAIFLKTWTRLPPTVRQAILDRWTVEENGSSLQPNPAVSFELSNEWGRSVGRNAEVRLAGFQMRFNAAKFERMPEAVGMFVIAHEFAHVYQHSAPELRQRMETWCKALLETGSREMAEAEMECHANELASKWGFDVVAYLKWE